MDVEYKIVNTQEDRIKCFRLLYDSYLEQGLIEENPEKLRILKHQLLPSTDIFLAENESPLFTLSLFSDDIYGLQIESLYKEEVQERRNQGLKLGEIGCLAGANMSKGFNVLLNICKLMINRALSRGLDELLISVNPRHEKFYTHFMNFRRFGEVKEYSLVLNNPAVFMTFNFNRVFSEDPKHFNFDFFFK